MTVVSQQHDFSGYATKANLKCTDGRTIMPEAFKHMDGMTVPLVWQHGHKDPQNVLGHAVLEAREDGVYAKGYFNDSLYGKAVKALVKHKDVKALSIYANQLVERAKKVFHGEIREVSVCLAGANPGAIIDNIVIAHGDDFETLEDAAIMSAGEEPDFILHMDDADDDGTDDEVLHATMQELYDTLTDDQKDLVSYMVGAALDGVGQSDDAAHADDNAGENDDPADNPGDNADDNEGDLNHHQEGTPMSRNVFEKDGTDAGGDKHVLSHDDTRGIIADFIKHGSLKHAVESYALEHGIEDIDVLFPEAKNISNTPEWNKRRTEWVAGVLGGTHKTPFSRIKTVIADITMESARALGYIKGNLKKEEWFALTKRTTGPTTVYKKQKLDRDDVIDIVDLDVVSWMKGEMRLMLEEEIARAILIGDGRPVEDPANPGDPNPDKIKDPAAAADGMGIRSILHEDELYAPTITVNIDDASSSMVEAVEAIMYGLGKYKGTGTPTFYTTQMTLTKMLLTKDGMQRRLWRTAADLAAEMGVDRIVPVEVMEGETDLVGIIVNLADYNIGADKGGEVSFFDDFDIDYNQLKYLGETRLSGALTKIRSALIVKKTAAANVLVAPTEPTFNSTTGVVTIPTKTGVVYKNAAGTTLTAGAQTALAAGASTEVFAYPASGYYFASSDDDSWEYTRDA